ncbi:MAG: hypothetical protein HQ518_13890 [Rhodopirellula sp.]|nr:hypothetical protein [Rhodopirellula sp.]
MMSSKIVLCGCVLASLVAVTAWGQSSGNTHGRNISVTEDLWLQLADEPGRHLQEARDHFFKNDRTSAAWQMRKAVVYLKISAENSSAKTEKNLRSSATELESLARGVESGTVTSIQTLEHAFSRAEHALAQHHYALANESWAKRESRIAGYRLRAAGDATERAARWTGEEIEEGAVATYRGTRTLGGKLIEGGGVVVDEVGKGIEAVGHQIEKVGKLVAPRN